MRGGRVRAIAAQGRVRPVGRAESAGGRLRGGEWDVEWGTA
jgi:hypothetical protein